MGCIFLLLCMPGNFSWDTSCYEFYLVGYWKFVCPFLITSSWLEEEFTNCLSKYYQYWGVSRGIFGHWHILSGDNKRIDLGWSYKDAWSLFASSREWLSPSQNLLPLSYSIFKIVYFMAYWLLVWIKKNRNLNYYSPSEFIAGARTSLLFSTKCVLFSFFFIILFIYSAECPFFPYILRIM